MGTSYEWVEHGLFTTSATGRYAEKHKPIADGKKTIRIVTEIKHRIATGVILKLRKCEGET